MKFELNNLPKFTHIIIDGKAERGREKGREREGRGIERKVFKELIKIKSLLRRDVPSLCYLQVGFGVGTGLWWSHVQPRGKAP